MKTESLKVGALIDRRGLPHKSNPQTQAPERLDSGTAAIGLAGSPKSHVVHGLGDGFIGQMAPGQMPYNRGWFHQGMPLHYRGHGHLG